MPSYGTNDPAISILSGGVNADNGAALISSTTDGEQAAIFGQPALREILSGVTNGDFSAIPGDPSSAVSSSNSLPYWSFTDVNSSGAISCAIVEDANLASGNKLRWTVAGSTATGKSAKISRLQPVLGDAGQDFCYSLEAVMIPSGNSTAVTLTGALEYVKADAATTVGTAMSVTYNLTTMLAQGTTMFVPDVSSLSMAIPSSAAFLRITITVATVATSSASPLTIDLSSVRLSRGAPRLWVAESTTPGTYKPATINQSDGVLDVQNGDGIGLQISPTNIIISEAPVLANDVETSLMTVLDDLYMGDDPNARTGQIHFKGTDGGIIAPFSATSGNSSIAIRNSADSAYAPIVASGFFPDQGTRNFGDDGTRLTASSAFRAGGIIEARSSTTTGAQVRSMRSDNTYCGFYWDGSRMQITDPITVAGNITATTLATASAGNIYTISTAANIFSRFTSSRRWKNNIEDADAGTLEAAKKLKAKHFNSLHAVDQNKRLLGFIVEEVAETGLDCAIQYDEEGLPYAYDHNVLIAALVVRLEDAERRIAELEAKA